jgi:hypothetical protein
MKSDISERGIERLIYLARTGGFFWGGSKDGNVAALI